uniref:TSA: Wollemia nobilis Ref_Wollemi_Transcript_737_784 transcribed RNA sequence n=1 Tax=Wollemia nobilis TaxID=56998 RepID=A0A0C9RZD9_9CONI
MAVRVFNEGLGRAALQWRNFTKFPLLRSLHEGPDTVEELLDRHVENSKRSRDDEDKGLARRRLTSTRREALTLYRDILRATRLFVWPNEKGVLWRDILRANARQEFEEARHERDPKIIARLLVGGRDAVQAAVDKAVEKHRQIVERERSGDSTRS